MASKKKSSKKTTTSRKSSRGEPASTRAKRGEPKTMEELLASTGQKIRSFSRGEKVEGEVIGITKKNVAMDIGGKSEGLVAEKAFDEAKVYIKGLKVGDKVRATVIVPESPDGTVILSLRHAANDAIWERIEKAQKTQEPISVQGKSLNPSGINIEIGNLLGFVPTSQLGKEAAKNPQGLIDNTFKAVVIETDRSTNRIILSERAVSESKEIEEEKKALKLVKEGELYEGKVTTVTDFGCFVEIKTRIPEKKETVALEGLVHISELSWEKVDKPSDVVVKGDKVKVKVIGVKDGKLSLSIKQAKRDPWDEVEEKYKKDTKVLGEVVRVSDFGVFVQIEPGVEGLVHLTKIPPGKKLNRGDKVDCYVEEVDGKNRRLSLGLVLTEKPVGYK